MMPFSYLIIFILLLIILLAILLLAPFNLSLSAGKKGPLIWGSIRLAWLGLTLKKLEISPHPVNDLPATIWKEEAGKGEPAIDERRANLKEKAFKKLMELGRKKDREKDGKKLDEMERDEKIEVCKKLIDVAPALMKILWDLLKSIHFKMSSCRLCFGLDDPAQTAIISGYLWSLTSVLGIFPANIFIDPWFDGERLEGEFNAEIEVRLLWPVFAVVKAMWVREVRLLLREMTGWM